MEARLRESNVVFGDVQVHVAPEIISFEMEVGIVADVIHLVLSVLVVKRHRHIARIASPPPLTFTLAFAIVARILINSFNPVYIWIDIRIKPAGCFADQFIGVYRFISGIGAGFVIQLHIIHAVQHFWHLS